MWKIWDITAEEYAIIAETMGQVKTLTRPHISKPKYRKLS